MACNALGCRALCSCWLPATCIRFAHQVLLFCTNGSYSMLQFNPEHEHHCTLCSSIRLILNRCNTHQPVIKTLTISVKRTTEKSLHFSLVRTFFSLLGTKTCAANSHSALNWWLIKAVDCQVHALHNHSTNKAPLRLSLHVLCSGDDVCVKTSCKHVTTLCVFLQPGNKPSNPDSVLGSHQEK